MSERKLKHNNKTYAHMIFLLHGPDKYLCCSDNTKDIFSSSVHTENHAAYIVLISSLADFSVLLMYNMSDCQLLLSAGMAPKATVPLPVFVFRR